MGGGRASAFAKFHKLLGVEADEAIVTASYAASEVLTRRT